MKRNILAASYLGVMGLCLGVAPLAAAQQAPATNYQILVNGKPVDVEAGKEYTVTTPKGETVRLELRENSVRSYHDEWVTLQYPAKLSVAETQEEGVRQIVLMNASGAGVLVQEYKGIDPAGIIDFMLSQFVKDDVKAGYKPTEKAYSLKLTDGKQLRGKTMTLSQKNKQLVYDVGAWSGENEGIVVVTIKNFDGSSDDAANQKLVDDVLKTLIIHR